MNGMDWRERVYYKEEHPDLRFGYDMIFLIRHYQHGQHSRHSVNAMAVYVIML